MATKRAGASADRRAKPAKKKRRKTPQATPRQSKLIAGIVEGKSTRQAALDAGYTQHTAAHPDELLSTEAVRVGLARLIAPLEKIAQRVNEGLDAEITEFAKFEGRITDRVNCVDFGQRLKYAELAARFKGFEDRTPLMGGIQNNIQVVFVNVDGLIEA